MKEVETYELIRNDVLQRMIEISFNGYDPSAFRFSERAVKIRKAIHKLPSKLLKKTLGSLFSRAMYYLGSYSIYILKPEKKVYAKGLALVLSGLSCEKNLKTNLINDIVTRLLALRLQGHFLWAHNIDYSFPGGIKVTTEIPNLVTTAFVANAFFDLYKATAKNEYKKIFFNIIDDVLSKIPYKFIEEGKICFMYTPVTDYHVHNANLLYAELLAKRLSLGIEESQALNLINLIEMSVNYSISDFKETGTYPYAGPQTRNFVIDNYHTGYLIRSLHEINEYTGKKLNLSFKLEEEVSKLLDFYVGNFVRNGLIVRDNKSTLESHSLAESILILRIFYDEMAHEKRCSLENAIKRTLHKLYKNEKNYFINNAKRIGPFYVKDSTEMVRWSNSWMYYSLSVLSKS